MEGLESWLKEQGAQAGDILVCRTNGDAHWRQLHISIPTAWASPFRDLSDNTGWGYQAINEVRHLVKFPPMAYAAFGGEVGWTTFQVIPYSPPKPKTLVDEIRAHIEAGGVRLNISDEVRILCNILDKREAKK